MKILFVLALLPTISFAEAPAAPAATPDTTKTGMPVETVKVTNENLGLFERVRDTYVRAEKKGLLALAPSASAPVQGK